MSTVNEIYQEIDKIAPFELAMGFDNCGLLVGSKNQEVTSCVLALDITNDVIEYAVKNNAQLIITHHPIIFNPLKTVTDDSRVFQLVKHNISVISLHTNLDIADGGVNDVLANLLKIENPTTFEGCEGVGRIGTLKNSMTGKELAYFAKEALGAKGVTVTGGDRLIKKVAICSGSGDDFLEATIHAKADAFITGEVDHDVVIDAINSNMTLICVGHYYSEAPVLYRLQEKLQTTFTEINFLVYDKFDLEEV